MQELPDTLEVIEIEPEYESPLKRERRLKSELKQDKIRQRHLNPSRKSNKVKKENNPMTNKNKRPKWDDVSEMCLTISEVIQTLNVIPSEIVDSNEHIGIEIREEAISISRAIKGDSVSQMGKVRDLVNGLPKKSGRVSMDDMPSYLMMADKAIGLFEETNTLLLPLCEKLTTMSFESGIKEKIEEAYNVSSDLNNLLTAAKD